MPHLILPADDKIWCCEKVAESVNGILLPLRRALDCEAIEIPGCGEYAETCNVGIRTWAPRPTIITRSSKEFPAHIIFIELERRGSC